MPPGPQRVYLHVGLPKTGTSFVQAVLFSSRSQLRDAGVLYPAENYDDHFFAGLDLQDLAFNGVRRPEAAGRWEELAEQVRTWPGTSVLSSEVLAAATPEHAQRAVDSLAPAQVHVVITARDLGTHLVSAWQEDVKHGETASFADWFAAVSAHDESQWNLAWYWQAADLPSVLDRWSTAVPASRVHVVTVPPPGSVSDTLWRRFAGAIELDPSVVDLSAAAWSNSGIGADGTALLRRLNSTGAGRLDQVTYEHLVKGVLAHETLSRYPGAIRPVLPADVRPHVAQRAAQWVGAVRASGAQVIGDLDELRGGQQREAESPAEPDAVRSPGSVAGIEPDDVAVDAVLDVAVFASWELLLQVGGLRSKLAGLEAELADLREREGQALAARGGPAKRLVRRASERSPAVMRARVTWWHAVERMRDR